MLLPMNTTHMADADRIGELRDLIDRAEQAGLAYKQAVRALELALTTQGQGRKVDPSPTVRPHRPAHSLAK